ncbi:DRAP deaminase [Bonamia ostreae]|uniref:DRAP deaminase n=1 Tax=Bonamia ostreae TaxID=126728 RepID=A0ABV2AGB2_9EUKA
MICQKFRQKMENFDLEKIYLARVTGHFSPENDEFVIENSRIVSSFKNKKPFYLTVDFSEKTGKASETRVKRICYDKATNSTLIKCVLVTGRTHQIRVHLRRLGHPIFDDYLYNENFEQAKTRKIDEHSVKLFSDLTKKYFWKDCRYCKEALENPKYTF